MASTRNIRVTTLMNKPFFMRSTNGSFEGFMVDLVDKIAEKVGFSYQFHLAPDGRYGGVDSTGQWNGMIGELVRGEADLAAADLTITAYRDRVIDFTKPYLSQSIRLLAKKPMRIPQRTDFLLEPFSYEIWFCIVVAMILVAILFMIIGRFNPYEWRQVPADKDPRGARHSFGVRDSLMFVISTFTLQGYRETPRSLAGRVLAVSWFIFIIITVIAYIGSVISFCMATSGSSSVMSLPFEGIDDFSEQSYARLGAIKGGSSFRRLQGSPVESHKRLANDMLMARPSVFVQSIDEGIKRVKRSGGNFVMLMESLTGEYIVSRECDLMMYGPGQFSFGLGLATPKMSDLRSGINLAILELMEDGTIHQLKRKWWDYGSVCPPYTPPKSRKSDFPFYASIMTLKKMVAPFIILLVGAILSVICLIGEVVFKKLRT